MRTSAKLTVSVGLALLSVFLSPGRGPASEYGILDLGTLGGDFSEARAVNAQGQVAGWSTTTTGATHAFLFDGIAMRDLGTLGGAESAAIAINAGGQVAGWSTTATGATHAFLFDGAVMRDLGTLGGNQSKAVAINAHGQVAGWSTTATGATHAFLFDGAVMRDLGTLGGDFSEPFAMNDSGQVVGWSWAATGGTHAFLHDGTAMRDLGTFGGHLSVALAINAGGQVVGWATTPPPESWASEVQRAFLYDGTFLRDLGTLGGERGAAVAINDRGQVVGTSQKTPHDTHAFLYDGGVMHDLGTPGGRESEALAINDAGLVLGKGDSAGDLDYHGFLWDSGRFTNLTEILRAAGWGEVDDHDQYLNDAKQIAGSGVTAGGETHAFLMTPTRGTRIAIDIKPGSPINSINPGDRGSVPIGLLSKPDLSAPVEIERASLTFGRTGEERSLARCNPGTPDLNGDGLPDLLCHFDMTLAGFQPGDTLGTLRGTLRDGTAFSGADLIRTVPP